jgi:hypothetical protein
VTTWLAGARSDARGLLIPGGPHGRAADLLLGAAAVEASHGSVSAVLQWSSYTKTRRSGVADSWALACWGGAGQGIGIDGPETLGPVRDAASSLLTRLAGWNLYNRFTSDYPLLPLWAVQHDPIWVMWQMPQAAALIQLLADRPELRSQLLDEQCTSQLAADLVHEPNATGAGLAVTPSAGAVTRALDGLGYNFRFGRPLPGDHRDTLDVVLDKVLSRLDQNAWGNVTVSKQRATEVIKMHYLDVSPWPFSALGV